MDGKLFVAVFGTVFLAKLGDKTQLATLLFATRESVSLWTVFAGASLSGSRRQCSTRLSYTSFLDFQERRRTAKSAMAIIACL